MTSFDEQDRCAVCNSPSPVPRDGRCSECGTKFAISGDRPSRLRFLSLPAMRYPNAYVWLIFASSLDILLTMLVLYVWRGHEVNPLIAAVIAHMGFRWAIVLKLTLIMLVIVLCEFVGRRKDRSGRRLAYATVAIAALPVAYTFALLLRSAPPIETAVPEMIATVLQFVPSG